MLQEKPFIYTKKLFMKEENAWMFTEEAPPNWSHHNKLQEDLSDERQLLLKPLSVSLCAESRKETVQCLGRKPWYEGLKTDHVSLNVVMKACESYAIDFLWRGARKGCKQNPLWSGTGLQPCCLATSILGQTSKHGPPSKEETGAGLMSTEQVSGFPETTLRNRGKQKQSTPGASDNTRV